MAFTLAQTVHSDLIIKKSRFIGAVQPAGDRAEALRLVAQLRIEHPAATHVCWALLAGGHSAANDDGEPGGTAGRPMLEVLRRQDLDGVLATVVRYYGGVKLGAGGLVRAYTDAVAQALLGVSKVPLEKTIELLFDVPYALEGTVRREVQNCGAQLVRVDHAEAVQFAVVAAEGVAAALRTRLDDAAQGQVRWAS